MIIQSGVNMGEYQRSGGRERKPARKFGGSFGADRQRGRFSRNSDESTGRYGGRPEGRFRRDDDRFSRQPTEAHDVVCDKCGRETTVPFKPKGNKPVYCRDCFNKKDDSFAKARPERDRPNYSADGLAKINQKLDKIMQALKIE